MAFCSKLSNKKLENHDSGWVFTTWTAVFFETVKQNDMKITIMFGFLQLASQKPEPNQVFPVFVLDSSEEIKSCSCFSCFSCSGLGWPGPAWPAKAKTGKTGNTFDFFGAVEKKQEKLDLARGFEMQVAKTRA